MNNIDMSTARVITSFIQGLGMAIILTLTMVAISKILNRSKEQKKINSSISMIKELLRSGTFIRNDEEHRFLVYRYEPGDKNFVSETWHVRNAGFQIRTIGVNKLVKVFY